MNPPSVPSPDSLTADMAAFPEMNPAPVIRADLAGRITLANAAARAMFDRGELAGKDWLELAGVGRPFWAAVLRGGATPTLEAAIGERVLNFTYRLAPDRASVFVFGADVTEFRRAEERIEQYTARMAEMARFPDMNPGPVLRTDRQATILLANVAAMDLFGQGALLGKCWKDVCPGMDGQLWDAILGAADVSRHETQVADRNFVFAHRTADDGDLVFIYGNDVTALRAAEEALRTSERMATLGTLSAGVAHELNNPAAAVARGAEQLRDAMVQLDAAFVPLSRVCQRADRLANLERLTLDVRARAERRLDVDALTRSDRESELEDWMGARGLVDSWEMAPALVSLDLGVRDLERIAADWGTDMHTVLRWMARAQPVYALIKEVGEASGRISEIVKALKTYSFLGQAPVRDVDLVEGLESTLVMLRAKLKGGIEVVREYEPALPTVPGFGSELNQVWTNLVDNAADAMNGAGRLVVRARLAGEWAVIEIEDDGPGIPEAIRQRVFDPFFTTKPVGKGTGLGLATAHSIVVKKHHGVLEVSSRPGCTRFTVRLPTRAHHAGQPDGATANAAGDPGTAA